MARINGSQNLLLHLPHEIVLKRVLGSLRKGILTHPKIELAPYK